jgi:hypothetical protein
MTGWALRSGRCAASFWSLRSFVLVASPLRSGRFAAPFLQRFSERRSAKALAERSARGVTGSLG